MKFGALPSFAFDSRPKTAISHGFHSRVCNYGDSIAPLLSTNVGNRSVPNTSVQKLEHQTMMMRALQEKSKHQTMMTRALQEKSKHNEKVDDRPGI